MEIKKKTPNVLPKTKKKKTVEPKKPKIKEPKKEKKKKKEPSKKSITVEYHDPHGNSGINENMYSKKLHRLLLKKKDQSLDTDNRIRFCWKN